jgi:hypothetical protein
MKSFLTFGFSVFNFLTVLAADKDSVINYALPDSVRAVSFMAEINISSYNQKKNCFVGIKTDAVSLHLENLYRNRYVVFQGHGQNVVYGYGVGQDLKTQDIRFNYKWDVNETYKLMISQATDSAGNFSLYSGYIFIPKESRWKLIGTIRIENTWNSIRQPASFYKNGKKQNVKANIGQVWVQRSNGSWKNMLQTNYPSPIVNLYSHVDSTEQLNIDRKLIAGPLSENKSDIKQEHNGIYYTMLKEGTGRQVSINDTVVAYYKGYLFKDGSVFDETKDRTATFPLNRLIRGWQIGVPLCKVGGKIRLIIPSDLAYSIRTRSAKIPPNSILVFEIEVVDAKAPQ